MDGADVSRIHGGINLSVKALARQVFPFVWIVGLIAAAFVGVALLLTRSSSGSSTATARIALTRAVEWPFFDASRSRLTAAFTPAFAHESFAGSPELRTKVFTSRVVMPDSQAYVDVVVTAIDLQSATMAADTLGRRLVADDLVRLSLAVTTQVGRAESQIVAARQAVADRNTEIAAQIDLSDSARKASRNAEADKINDNVRFLQNERDQAQRDVGVIGDALTRARLSAAAIQPEVEYLNVSSTSAVVRKRRTLQLLVAGLGGATVGSFLAWAVARQFGRVNDDRMIEQMVGLPAAELSDDLNNTAGWDWLTRTVKKQGVTTVGLAGAGANEALADRLREPGRIEPIVLQLNGLAGGPSSLSVDRVILVAVRGRTRFYQLTRLASAARLSLVRPAGVLVVNAV